MAHEFQLSEVDRCHLRHRQDSVPLCGRSHRQQVPDPSLCGRRADAKPPGARCRNQRIGRLRLHAPAFLLLQGSRAWRGQRPALRSQCPAPALLVDLRRRQRDRQRSPEEVQRLRHPGRQHRRADGRLVQEGNQHARGSQGFEDSRRRAGRSDLRAGRRQGALSFACRRLFGPGNGHHRCRRIHLPARRRTARYRQAGEIQLPPVLVGKRRHGASDRQSGTVECAAQALPRHRRARLQLGQFLDAGAV